MTADAAERRSPGFAGTTGAAGSSLSRRRIRQTAFGGSCISDQRMATAAASVKGESMTLARLMATSARHP